MNVYFNSVTLQGNVKHCTENVTIEAQRNMFAELLPKMTCTNDFKCTFNVFHK